MSKQIARLVVSTVSLGLGAFMFCNHAMAIPPIDKLGMQISDREMQAIELAMQYGREISKAAEKVNGLPYRRDAHAKATGCVRATFTVNPDIPSYLQSSVFSEPGKAYEAWIRFSNGDMTVQADSKPDARGMAVKLVNVEGEPIAPELGKTGTQDFIMTNMAAFFHRDIYDYVEDMRYLAQLKRTRWFISLWPPRLHPKQFYRAIQTVSAKIDNPLSPQYYSMLPYALGDTVVKFSAKACDGMSFDNTANKKDFDYLTQAMANTLKDGAGCFQFMVQEQKPGYHMPVDDATVIWREEDSPFVPIATINIPPQTFTSEAQQMFCEDLSMNPWHGVGDWQPIGSLNRSRRLVYHAVSQFRHQQNNASVSQPTSWCIQGNQCDLTDVIHAKTARADTPLTFDGQYKKRQK